ncbi:MAG: ABC transporter substrate-binding protein [Pyrinomonadaceae bacterium]
MKRNAIIIGSIILILVIGGIWYFVKDSRQMPSNKPPQPFRVGLATYPGFAPGFIAKEKGFFGDLPVEFTILDDFTVRQNAFTSGQNDATISTLDSYAFESGQGVKGKAFLILDESSGADAIVVSPKIKQPSDIKGKKVAYTRGSPSQFLLMQFLRKNGLSGTDIQRVEVDDPGRAGEAFVAGSVDVAVTWEPNISQIVSSGKGRVLESTKTFPDLIFDVMVIGPEPYDKRKEDIKKFVNGWLKAIEFIKTNQNESYSIMARNMNIPESDFPAMAGVLKFADLDRNKQLLLPPGNSKAISIYNEAVRIWSEEKLIQVTTEGKNQITSEFVENLK